MNKYKALLWVCAFCILIIYAFSVIQCVDIYILTDLHMYGRVHLSSFFLAAQHRNVFWCTQSWQGKFVCVCV